MTQQFIPLSALHFGRDANPPINARRTKLNVDIPELAASIAAHGQIHALSIRQVDGLWYVADGDRRLAAQQYRAQRGEISIDELIKCDDDSDTGTVVDAEELSVAANIMREPLHEADVYEAFRRESDRGVPDEQIAARFGVEVSRVKKWLALGRLSPVILDAWRTGAFDREAIQCIHAFTLAPSIEAQEVVFAVLKEQGHLYPHVIRAKFGAGDQNAARWLKIIGLNAYKAAGGKMTQDLFGEHHVIADPALAESLAQQLLASHVTRLKGEGWGWSALGEDLPQGWNWNWSKLNPTPGKPTAAEKREIKALELERDVPGGPKAEGREDEIDERLAAIQTEIAGRAFNADDKAKSGAVVSLSHYGEIQFNYGVMKPEAAKKATKDPITGKPASAPMISNAMTHRLSLQATQATRVALLDEPRVGLVALLSGHLAGAGHGPIKVRHEGYGAVNKYGQRTDRDETPESFAAIFARLSAYSDADLFRVAAGIASLAIDLQCHNAGNLPFDKGADLLAAAIEPERMNKAMASTFDAPDYFASVSKPFVTAAVAEAVNPDEARKVEKLKKDERVAYAVENVVPTGWLPPELRTASYAGPGAAS